MSKNKEIRCVGCNKKLAEGSMVIGEIVIACRCGVKNTITATADELEVPIRIGTAENSRMNNGSYGSRLHNRLEKK